MAAVVGYFEYKRRAIGVMRVRCEPAEAYSVEDTLRKLLRSIVHTIEVEPFTEVVGQMRERLFYVCLKS